MRYRKIAVEIEAKPWSPSDVAALSDWTNGCVRKRADGVYTGEIFDELHDTWIPLRTGDMIIQGVEGEFYPCKKSVFGQTYEPVG